MIRENVNESRIIKSNVCLRTNILQRQNLINFPESWQFVKGKCFRITGLIFLFVFCFFVSFFVFCVCVFMYVCLFVLFCSIHAKGSLLIPGLRQTGECGRMLVLDRRHVGHWVYSVGPRHKLPGVLALLPMLSSQTLIL